MPACEPTDEKLRRKNYKAIGLGTKVALFVIRPPAHTSLSERSPVPISNWALLFPRSWHPPAGCRDHPVGHSLSSCQLPMWTISLSGRRGCDPLVQSEAEPYPRPTIIGTW